MLQESHIKFLDVVLKQHPTLRFDRQNMCGKSWMIRLLMETNFMAAMKDEPPTETELSKKMRLLADGGKHPRALELVARARDLDAATYTTGENFNVKKLVGCWARARRLWSDITGEDLV